MLFKGFNVSELILNLSLGFKFVSIYEEELIRLKGFEDVVILMNDNNINVIVRIAVLTKAQVVQIQNIVMKELQVSVDQISISTK